MTASPKPRSDIRARLGLRPIINVSGTMTTLGASIVVPQAVKAVSEVLPEWVDVTDLHRMASRAIAKATGTEAGFVTASAAAGITLAIAGCMTGPDLGKIEQLPDTSGMKNEVAIQIGHLTGYGASVEQAIRLAGGVCVPVGNIVDAKPYQLAHKITDRTAAALYVVSHSTSQYGQMPLDVFARVAHDHGVPVIADLASEYDLTGFAAAGADLVIYSAHKFLGGPTAGIVGGRKALVRATFLQNHGIGRGMKVGKESIVGTIAALEAWAARDHAGIRKQEKSHLDLWVKRFSGLPGVTATIIPDPTANPLDRLKLDVDPEGARITAWELADALGAGDPPVAVRDMEAERGYFYLDPCNLHPGEAEIVADRVVAELGEARKRNRPQQYTVAERQAKRLDALLRWPD